MKQILWFRRDLRISDNRLLSLAKDQVLPLFIFDTKILEKLPKEDKRLSFIYRSVMKLKYDLQKIGLDLAIFYGDPIEIFTVLAKESFDEIVASVDFDHYARTRDDEISKIIPIQKVYDSFLLHPEDILKQDGTPYKVFTPFYRNAIISFSQTIPTVKMTKNLTLIPHTYEIITLKHMGFTEVWLDESLLLDVETKLQQFKPKISVYKNERDLLDRNATSGLGIYLRFGLLSPKQLLNTLLSWQEEGLAVKSFIRQLFWREFFNMLLYHFPQSQNENFDHSTIVWSENRDMFDKWCNGNTGVPIVDAAMRELKNRGQMHNRLRMITASFLTKNLLIDWRLGEKHFAQYLLDYEASSNIGSWQWVAGTGADSAPYFRVFNPYLQSKKFDPQGCFIKSVFPKLQNVDPKHFHHENGLQNDSFISYPQAIVNIRTSRQRAIETFKRAKYAV
ncbi:MAG: DNA photolyase family protein [Epsilonproteobacteria bacterium]|nr:DNA photolyase family protein [Campylobacterota bacterium]